MVRKDFLKKFKDKPFFLQDFPHHTLAYVDSLEELVSKIKSAPNTVISHHLRSGGNDFATWIGEVLGHKKLATKLKKIRMNGNTATVRKKLLDVLEKELSILKKK